MLYACRIATGQGWSTAVLDLHVEHLSRAAAVARILSFRPDLLLVDSMSATVPLARDLATVVRTKLPRTRIWAIGQHATVQPSDLLTGDGAFDGALQGELDAGLPGLLALRGERAVDGCAVWEEGTIRTLGERAMLLDLDTLPPLDPAELHLSRYHMSSFHVPSFRRSRWGFLLTSRGCPYECTFCSPTLRQSYGRQFRAQSADRVVDDMRRLHRDHRVDTYYLIDDIASLDRGRMVEICDHLRCGNPGIRWAIQTRADAVDRDLLRLLKEAGCIAVKIGVESGSDRILETLKKGVTTTEIRAAVREIHAVGLSLTACFMVGNPDETVADIRQTMRFAKELRADMIQVAFNTPYPGSALHEQSPQPVRDLGNYSHYDARQVNLSRVEDATLDRLQRRFYLEYFTHPPLLLRYLRRRGLYSLFGKNELALIGRTLRYLLLRPGRGALEEGADGALAAGRGPARNLPGLARDGLAVHRARRSGKAPAILPLLYLDVTTRCNLRCRYCGFASSYPQPREELTTDELRSILEQAAALRTRIVSFGGGEPFLRADVPELMSFAASLGIGVHGDTNGTCLDSDLVERLAGISGLTLVLSLDHPDAVRNDALRGPGTFDAVRNAVRLLRTQAPGIRVGINAVLGPHNLDVLEDLAGLVAGWGVSSLKLLPLDEGLNHAWRREPLDDEDRWRPEHRVILAARLRQYRRAARQHGLMTNSAAFLASVPASLEGPVPHRCFAGFLFASVDPFGYLFPCYHHSGAPADLRSETLAAAWGGAAMQRLRRDVTACGERCWCSGNAEPSLRMAPAALQDPAQLLRDLWFYLP